MNPVHLETLLAIVDEGSFEYAATVLGITPSAVSQRIKSLEASTGRVLLRRANPVTATDAGEILVQSARRMALVQAETDARSEERRVGKEGRSWRAPGHRKTKRARTPRRTRERRAAAQARGSARTS